MAVGDRRVAIHGLPLPRLDHLRRMTDDTGLIQHAIGPVPDRRTGYTTDDNARALYTVLRAARTGTQAGLDLAERYLAFLAYAQEPDGGFHNFFGYDRRPLPETRSEDCQGRVLRALVEAAWFWREDGYGWTARQLLVRAAPAAARLGTVRGLAQAALAWAQWCQYAREAEGDPPADLPTAWVEGQLAACADALCAAYRRERQPGWHWFEDTMTYDNAVLPHALLLAGRVAGREDWTACGLETLQFLAETTFVDDVFRPVGNHGWYRRGGRCPDFDQQPLEAGAMVEACLEAYRVTEDDGWYQRALQAAAWFVGHNLLELPLVDPATGGCCDGLRPDGVNRNQGAESTLAWLSARYALLAHPAPAILLVR